MDSLFWHSMHLQFSLQSSPSWKHSQYFLMQKDLRQEQPLTARTPSMATGFPGTVPLTVRCSFMFSPSFWLWQSLHRQLRVHSCPAAKHSQYNFMHFELRQLHVFY
jgi:hypothetical protein